MSDHSHARVRMTGRDITEDHRSASPLELLFDLSFVVAFGAAANELAHALAEEHISTGLIGFGVAAFAISWAWINFSWFASAYDTDDWVYRLLTMVQMVGVVVVALGIPDLFASLEAGREVDNQMVVLGYVIMRVPLVAQWLRAARQDRAGRPAATTYAVAVVLAQAGWVALAVASTDLPTFLLVGAGLLLVELAGPVLAETRFGGTPWHPHHIAERYGLMVIIALGEGLIGTVAALRVVLDTTGWTLDFVLLCVAGITLTFGIWWTYFVIPSGEALAAHRKRAFGWGYGQMLVFAAVVAAGAGLHVAAYHLEHHYKLGSAGTVYSVLIPAVAYLLLLYALYSALTHTFDPFHLVLIALTLATAGIAVAMAESGAPVTWTLLVVAATPWITVVGYELRGHRHNEQVLAGLREER